LSITSVVDAPVGTLSGTLVDDLLSRWRELAQQCPSGSPAGIVTVRVAMPYLPMNRTRTLNVDWSEFEAASAEAVV
jgi:hypothetical protein